MRKSSGCTPGAGEGLTRSTGLNRVADQSADGDIVSFGNGGELS